jgi:hypothetical protein
MIAIASGKIPRRTLDHATDDEQPERAGECRDEDADRHGAQRGDEDALLAEHIAQAPEDRCRHRGAQQERGQHPGGAGRRRVQVELNLAQGRDDERLQHRQRHRAEGEDPEREGVVLAPLGVAERRGRGAGRCR